MLTLGTWLAPVPGAVTVVVGVPTGLRWHSRRGNAIRRIAERLAWEDSTARGYPGEYRKYLDHYLGGKPWRGEDEGAINGKPGSRRTVRRWRGEKAA